MDSNHDLLDLDDFELSKKLDVINNNEFYEVINKKTNKLYFAKILMHELKNLPLQKQINISHELNVLPKLTHPSILRYIGYSPVDFSNNPNLVIITEPFSKDTLSDICKYKKKEQKSLGWTDSKKYINIYGIALAMQYLHSHDIIHCDLNTDNVYLDSSFYPKVNGFEYSKTPLNMTVNCIISPNLHSSVGEARLTTRYEFVENGP
ncbi:hypothetical protein M9Y10_026953 [Tritrichomonas musculus]|uniref:Protein kinase domain-containing protein n=1 Tax=Tritrichomonas musculus TaxID=1915356 RepID=A0ABR2H556_9EUKA